jgi:uncharacterized protein involved in exopolysaccharide biosynthesis
MRPETEARPRRARALPELDAEREVDVARHGRAVLERWWLVLAAVVLGALVGWLFSAAASSDVNRAEATIYLGQPVSFSGGGLLPSVATNPAAVREIARSDEVVAEVAGEVGVAPAKLRSGISTSAVSSGAVTRQNQTNQVFEVSVRGPWAKRTVAQATNLIAAAVVERTSGYVSEKIAAYEEQLGAQEDELAAVDRRVAELERAASGPGLTSVERLTLTSLIGFAEERRGDLLEDRAETRLLLAQARDVEQGGVVAEARATQVTPRSNRSAVIVGGLLGLLAGIVLALAWEPLRRRRRLRVS